MRRVARVCLSIVGSWVAASSAGATIMVDCVWVATTGTGFVTDDAILGTQIGDVNTLGIQVTVDELTQLSHIGFSLEWDPDLAGFMDYAGSATLVAGFFTASSSSGPTSITESIAGSQVGIASSFEFEDVAVVFPGTYTIATLDLLMQTGFPGPNLFVDSTGFSMDLAGEGFYDLDDNPVPVVVHGVVPEPSTAGLLGLGLVALSALRARRR